MPSSKAQTSTKASPLTEASDSDLLSIIEANQKIVNNLETSTDMCDYMKSELAERKVVNAMNELQKRHGCYLPQKRHFTFNGTQSEETNLSIERCLNDPENTYISDQILAIKNNKLRDDVVNKILVMRNNDYEIEQDMMDTCYFDAEHENIDESLFKRNKIVSSTNKDHRDTAIIQHAPKRMKTKHERFAEPVQLNIAVADAPEDEILVPMNIQFEKVQSGRQPNLSVQSNAATADTVSKFQCLKCEASFLYKRDLTRHNIESHINTEMYHCDVCKTLFGLFS